MTHRTHLVPFLLVALAPTLVGADPAAAAPAADLCASFGEVTVTGTLGNPELVEASGIVASRTHPGVLWSHNDSGDVPRLFALDETGRDLGTYAVDGAEALDWEDIAIGPGPDAARPYLYIADIGDNAAARVDGLSIYRVPEPDVAPTGAGGRLAGVEVIGLRYPDGPQDAEAVVVDPVTGDLVVVTKDLGGASHVMTVAAADLAAGTQVTATDEGVLRVTPPPVLAGLPGTMVTAADVAPDGTFVLVRAYQSVLAFPRSPGQSLAEALLGTPCDAPSASEPQGEAIAVLSGGRGYVTVSEAIGGEAPPLHVVTITGDAAPPEPTTTTETSTTAAETSTAAVGTSTTAEATETSGPATETSGPATTPPATDASAGATTPPPPQGSDGAGASPWLVAAGVAVVAIGGLVLFGPLRRR